MTTPFWSTIHKVLAFISRCWNRILLSFRRHWYATYFTRYAKNFTPLGPLEIYNEGELTVGENFSIRSFAHLPVVINIGKNARVHIGNNVYLNQGVRIGRSRSIEILDGCMIGDETLILDNDFHSAANGQIRCEPICIGPNVWIAARCTILRGVTIGEGSIVATGSVVTHSVPPYTLVGGVPAKKISALRNLKE